MSDAWHVRFSPGGRLAYGSAVLSVDGVAYAPGTSPRWLSDEDLCYTRQPDGALVHWPRGAVLDPGGFNDFDACAGRWAGWHAGRDELVTSWGLRLPGCRMPRLSATGLVYAQATPDDQWRIVGERGDVLVEGAVMNLRVSPAGVVTWMQHDGRRWAIWGVRPGGAPERLQVAAGDEFWPVPLDTPHGPWVLSHTHTALLLRPWGRDAGYVVHVGVTDFPDAVWTPEGWRVAWSARGVLDTRLITPDTQRTIVVRGPEPPPAPEPPHVTPAPEPPVPYTSIAPNMFHVVQAVHAEHPGLIHQPHAFTAAVAARLFAQDARWGRNGKRGHVEDLSEDCVAYQAPGSPAGGVEIYDIIAQANSPAAAPAWIDQTQATIDGGTIGAWVPPTGVSPGPTPTPVPIPGPTPPVAVPCQALTADQVMSAVRQELAVVLERVAHTAGVVQRMAEALGAIRGELEAAAQRREELADLTAERLTAATTAPREVTLSGRVSYTGTTTWKGQVR